MRCKLTFHLLALAGAAGLITGCGADDVPPAAIADAADRTAAADSARVDVEGSVEAAGLTEPMTFEATGAVDNQRQAGNLEFERFELPSAAAGALPPDAFEGEMVFDELIFYMRFPAFEGELPGGKEWLKIDLEEAGSELGIDVAQFAQLGRGDPTQSLEYLRAVSDEVEEVGTEDVRGAATTHYRATIELSRYPELVPEDEREAAEESVDRLIELSGSEEIPVEVWVDEDGMVRRYEQTQTTEVPGAGESTISQTIDLYDFGTEVEVDIPSDDEVLDATKLAGQAPAP